LKEEIIKKSQICSPKDINVDFYEVTWRHEQSAKCWILIV